MPAPPSQADLEALAERALPHLAGDGQATAWWERGAENTGGALVYSDRVRVEVAALGAGIAVTDDLSDDGLRAAARAAAGLPGPRWPPEMPDPAPGRAHDGYDPAAAGMGPEPAAAAIAPLPAGTHWRSAAAKLAIASTRGVRAYEQRSFAELVLAVTAAGRPVHIGAAAPGPAGLDADALAAEFLAMAGEGAPGAPVPAGERPVVLGPWAVAMLLEVAAWQFSGAAAGRFTGALGKRLVAPAVNLSDSPRFSGTLPRSYDAEGSPVQPLPLIQDGVAHRAVHDATTAARAGTATTGHATRPAGFGAPRPRNLVLVGGGAAGVAELAAGIDDGLLIASLHRLGGGDRLQARGVRRIAHGELGPPAPDVAVRADLFDVLAATDALTARQWLVPAAPMRSPRDASAAVVPALRARSGVHFV
jgi:PmbA/TldA metallopeptidase C-terminal domain